MSDDARRDREAIFLAILIGVFAALVILLVIVLLARSGGDGDTPATTTAAPATTTAAPATTAAPTTAAPTTAATTTTAAPATTSTTTSTTTTTTTTVPFSGDTDWKGCTASGPAADTVFDVRFAQRDGFTRVVFDFAGGIPACNVGYADPHTLAVIVYPIDLGNPFAAGIFDGSGQLQINTNSVNRVSSGGMGGGSGEWEFSIDIDGTRAFRVFTLENPSRLAIDIED